MLKINRDNQSFLVLDTPSLAKVSIIKRYDLQEYICNSPKAFFNEIGQAFFLIGKEIRPSKNVPDLRTFEQIQSRIHLFISRSIPDGP